MPDLGRKAVAMIALTSSRSVLALVCANMKDRQPVEELLGVCDVEEFVSARVEGRTEAKR